MEPDPSTGGGRLSDSLASVDPGRTRVWLTLEASTEHGVYRFDPDARGYRKVRDAESVHARHSEDGEIFQVVLPPDSGGRFSVARFEGLPTDSDALPTFFTGSPRTHQSLPGGFGYVEAGVEFPLAGLLQDEDASIASRRTEFVLSLPPSGDGKPVLFDFRSPIVDPSGDEDRPLGFQSSGDITIVEIHNGNNRELLINGEPIPLSESGPESHTFDSVFIETDRSGVHYVSVTSTVTLSDGQVRTREVQHEYFQKRLVFEKAFPVLELPPGTPFTVENSFRWDGGNVDVAEDDPEWTLTIAALDGSIVVQETGATSSISVNVAPPQTRGESRPVEVVLADSPRHRQLLAQEEVEDKEIWVMEATASARTFPAGTASPWRGGTTPRTGEEGRYYVFAGGEADPGQQRVEVGTILLDPPLDQIFVDSEPIPEGEEPEIVTTITAGVAVIGLLEPEGHYWLEVIHEPTGDQVLRFPAEEGGLEPLEGVLGIGASDSVHFYGIELPWDGRDINDPSRIIVNDPFTIRIYVDVCGHPVTEDTSSRVLTQESEPMIVCLEGEGDRRFGSGPEVEIKQLRFGGDSSFGPNDQVGPFRVYNFKNNEVPETFEWNEPTGQTAPLVFRPGSTPYCEVSFAYSGAPSAATQATVFLTLEEDGDTTLVVGTDTLTGIEESGEETITMGPSIDALSNVVGRFDSKVGLEIVFRSASGTTLTSGKAKVPIRLYKIFGPPVHFGEQFPGIGWPWYNKNTYLTSTNAQARKRSVESILDMATAMIHGLGVSQHGQAMERLTEGLHTAGWGYISSSGICELNGTTIALPWLIDRATWQLECTDFGNTLRLLAGAVGLGTVSRRFGPNDESLTMRTRYINFVQGINGYPEAQFVHPMTAARAAGVELSNAGEFAIAHSSVGLPWVQFNWFGHQVVEFEGLIYDAAARLEVGQGDHVNTHYYLNQRNILNTPDVPGLGTPREQFETRHQSLLGGKLPWQLLPEFGSTPESFYSTARYDASPAGAAAAAPLAEYRRRLLYLEGNPLGQTTGLGPPSLFDQSPSLTITLTKP